MNRKRQKRFRTVIYLILLCTIVIQAARIIYTVFVPREVSSSDPVMVNVDGNIDRPGTYRVPRGTSQFEILQVAGVRPNSNISAFNLAAQITDNQAIEVEQATGAVGTMQEQAMVRLEFYFGELSIIAGDGRSRPAQEGLTLKPGDRILTEARTQAELSINTYSRVDLDNFAELTVEKVGEAEGDKNVVEFYQRSGICWYKTVYSNRSELFRIITPNAIITVAGSGADFVIDVQYEAVHVHNIDGLVLIERLNGEESINLISGQAAVIYSDGRPFQVQSITADVSPNETFSELIKEKTNYMLRHMPLNFLFCGIPNVYYLVSLQFEQGKAHIVQLPPSTSVEQFVQGVTTLAQAHLHGGPVFAGTLVERIMDTRIPKYCVFDRTSIVRTASVLGNIIITIDSKAAAELRLPAGPQQLSPAQLFLFLKPSISGWEDSYRRQTAVLKAIFESFRTRGIVLNALLATQLVSGIETNFSSDEIMRQYSKFTSRKNWDLSTHKLPTAPRQKGKRVIYEPDLEHCRQLLY
ncbi:MAG: hypothetical protein GF401_17495 [Chitinivibrionales bacterium]|nr:hypothetical protein [Chitinivibrionales bacterium]